jgi:hypothetical protein
MINDFINDNGDKKYAFVTLMIDNIDYISGAIVLSYSLRKVGTLCDLIILINDNINEKDYNLLTNFYDVIIKIKPKKIKHENKIQQIILNKLEGLKLINYEKICLIDIDSLILYNIDNLFNKETPSCINTNNELNTGLILLKPDLKIYDKINNLLLNESFLILLKNSKKPLIIILKKLYHKIYEIEKKYLNINDYKNSYGIQYSKDKPFIIKSSDSLEARSRLDINKIWYYYFLRILNKYPEFREIESLKQVLEISKYFLEQNSRSMKKYKDLNKKKKKIIKNLYNIDNEDENNEYYHLDISKEYNTENLNFVDDLFILNNFTTYLIDKGLIKDNIKINNINNLVTIIKDENIIDYILNYYIKIKDNIIIGIIIDKNEITDDNFFKKNLIYIKKVKLVGISLKNILFNIDQNKTYQQKIIELSKYNDYETYFVNIYIFKVISSINFYDNQKNNSIIIYDKNTQIRVGSIFLNNNTLSRYNNKIKLINNNKINRKNLLKLIKFQTIKKWIYNNYDGNNLNNIIFYKNDNKLLLIDNITKKKNDKDLLLSNKIKLFDIIFGINNTLKKIIEITKNINNYKKYWELEGIKFYLD